MGNMAVFLFFFLTNSIKSIVSDLASAGSEYTSAMVVTAAVPADGGCVCETCPLVCNVLLVININIQN